MYLRLKHDQVTEGELLTSWIDDGTLLVHSPSFEEAETTIRAFDIPNLSNRELSNFRDNCKTMDETFVLDCTASHKGPILFFSSVFPKDPILVPDFRFLLF